MTPMLKQYFEIKEKNKDKILFFRLGDFYEMFGDNAITASEILDITLTARYKGTENEIPMCGIPYHAANQYIPKLTKAGCKVAICEQVSDSSLPGIVNRKVVQVITPGTTLDSSLLDRNENNFLASVAKSEEHNGQINFGISFVDLTTGEFKVLEIEGEDNLIGELKRINPAEIIVDEIEKKSLFEEIKEKNPKYYLIFKNVSKFNPVGYFEPEKILCRHFKINSLKSFGIETMKLGIKAAGNLIMYLKDTQRTELSHINKISIHNPFDYMILDDATVRNLDLIYNYQIKGKEGSLLSVLDKTNTAMGGRLLKQWILHPLIKFKDIQERLDIVEYCCHHSDLCEEIRVLLQQVADIERLMGRIGCNRANPKDLILLKDSLKMIENIKSFIENYENHCGQEDCEHICIQCCVGDFEENFDSIKEVISLIEKIIIDSPPASIIEGGIIKDRIDSQLDELRAVSYGGKEWIAELQIQERVRTGINSLKVRFNRVFGYYIEISKANINSVPEEYMRKQTLVNGERFITPKLKEYEEKVLTAEEKIKDIEYKIFNNVVLEIASFSEKIQKVAQIIGRLDVLSSFAHIAVKNNYTRPIFKEEGAINIKEGRHPVVEKIEGIDYVPNDAFFDDKTHQLIILTGPNMAGKSVYLRQNALISLMAQIGSFVPASLAELCIADRIFTRVGASDNIAQGQSTFMVEMQEAARILHHATEKSLIIFDELGRGTSTYDGVSIAWAVIEYICENIKAKTIFATHYHELSVLADNFPRIQNYRMAVLENDEGVIFLHKIVKGGIDKSYGIEVAKLAGLPTDIINRANTILSELESGKNNFQRKDKAQSLPLKIGSEIENEFKKIDINNMTPVEVMNWIVSVKRKL